MVSYLVAMGRKYEQLSLEDRCEIARLQAEGQSIRQIAAGLDRSPSTISRELKRNRGRHIGLYEGGAVKGYLFRWCLAILIALGYGFGCAVKPRSREAMRRRRRA
jgi:hypothetical protein